ncbi:MAG: hypothetical protein AB7I27_14885 [Bacteriovoracaceae bacterium]
MKAVAIGLWLSLNFVHAGPVSLKVDGFDDITSIDGNINRVKILELKASGKLDQFIQNLVVTNSDLLGDYETFDKLCKANANCTENESRRVLALKVLDFALLAAGRRDEALACTQNNGLLPIYDFLDKFKDLRKSVDGCAELRPGEFKLNTAKNLGGGQYILHKKNDGNYQAILDLNFVYQDGSFRSVEVMNRVRSCLKQVAPYLKGPDGKNLEILALTTDEMYKIQFPDGIIELPATQTIYLQNSAYRSNVQNYRSGIECPTITHEILHLLGLCDEYRETDPSLREMARCRVVPRENSIMKDDFLAFNESVPLDITCSCESDLCKFMLSDKGSKYRKAYLNGGVLDIVPLDFRINHCDANKPKTIDRQSVLSEGLIINQMGTSFTITGPSFDIYQSQPRVVPEGIHCRCDENDLECLKEKEKILTAAKNFRQRESCPDGEKENKREISTSGNKGVVFQGDKFTLTTTPTKPGGLLFPNHFKKILTGGCESSENIYDRCASFAYKGSQDGPSACDDIPKECTDDSAYLGVKQ